MIYRIKQLKLLSDFVLYAVFDDGKEVFYDVKEDMCTVAEFTDLQRIPELFQQAKLDESRTCVSWNEYIDLPSDIICEYGIERR